MKIKSIYRRRRNRRRISKRRKHLGRPRLKLGGYWS